jgi:hypothetical protein
LIDVLKVRTASIIVTLMIEAVSASEPSVNFYEGAMSQKAVIIPSTVSFLERKSQDINKGKTE